MCGIVGYVGHRDVSGFLLEGLHRLEYRGYDSAGIAVLQNGEIQVRKKAGRVQELNSLVDAKPVRAKIGIGHTRWATHGETSDVNSHPHLGGNGDVVLVHNGVIENYTDLQSQLKGLGYIFKSQTDSEVIAHLLDHHLQEQTKLGEDPSLKETCLKALQLTTKQLKGTMELLPCSRNVQIQSFVQEQGVRWSLVLVKKNSLSGVTQAHSLVIRKMLFIFLIMKSLS